MNFFTKRSEKEENRERFESLMKLSGWKPSEVTRRMKISPSRISNWLKVERDKAPKIPREIVDLLSAKVAEETTFKDRPNGMVISDADGNVKEAIYQAIQSVTAPIIAFAQGGEGAYPEDQGPDSPRISVPCKDPNCYVLELQGNSMEPIYLEGDLLVVAPNTPPQNNDLVVVRTVEDEVLFKQFKHPRRGEEFQFVSYNPHHPPLLLRPDQIFRVSVVDCVIRPLKHKVKAMTVR